MQLHTRYEITFTGMVQGVGFRYTTHSIAARHKVGGWVRNEPDGSVRCVAEGEKPELDRFLVAVQNAMGSNIRETQLTESTATGEFAGQFSIRR